MAGLGGRARDARESGLGWFNRIITRWLNSGFSALRIATSMIQAQAVTGTQIAANTVQNSNLVPMAAGTVKANTATSSGNPQDVALGSQQILIGNTTGGGLAVVSITTYTGGTGNTQSLGTAGAMTLETTIATVAGTFTLPSTTSLAIGTVRALLHDVAAGGNVVLARQSASDTINRSTADLTLTTRDQYRRLVYTGSGNWSIIATQ